MKKYRKATWCLVLLLWAQSTSAQLLSIEEQVIDDQVDIGYGLAIGDVDGDGDPDILMADASEFVWYSNPGWNRHVMVENLTERDNVCLTARDLDGDGKVEVAVGARWNPGETSDPTLSGSVHYLQRPDNPMEKWKAIELPHEPTVHRMHWVMTTDGAQLVVLPLHGRGNVGGKGAGVKVFAYGLPETPGSPWKKILVDSSMHLTHNFEVVPGRSQDALLIGGKEGSKFFGYHDGTWNQIENPRMTLSDGAFGEIRFTDRFIAGIQPMHGKNLVVYPEDGSKQTLLSNLAQGHAVACEDLINQGLEQIVVGWREANSEGDVGVKIMIANDGNWSSWQEQWIDQNGMACEDLKIADLNDDGKPDIIAAGRSTHNLKIYWNKR